MGLGGSRLGHDSLAERVSLTEVLQSSLAGYQMLSLLSALEDVFFLHSGYSKCLIQLWHYGIHQRGGGGHIPRDLFPGGPKVLLSVKIQRSLNWMGSSKRRIFQKECKKMKAADPQRRPHGKQAHAPGYPSLGIGSVFLDRSL